MAQLTPYKNVNIVQLDPPNEGDPLPGDAGQALNDNFKALADGDETLAASVSSNTANISAHAALTTSAHGGIVPSSRAVSTSAPLQGGGPLGSNLTLSIDDATTSSKGSMSAADKLKLDAATDQATPDTIVMRDSSSGLGAGYVVAPVMYVQPTDFGYDGIVLSGLGGTSPTSIALTEKSSQTAAPLTIVKAGLPRFVVKHDGMIVTQRGLNGYNSGENGAGSTDIEIETFNGNDLESILGQVFIDGTTAGNGGNVKLQAGEGGADHAGVGGNGIGGEVVVNDLGKRTNFRVEGDTDANTIFVDAVNDRVGIGTASPSTKLDINGTVNATAFTGSIDAATINSGTLSVARGGTGVTSLGGTNRLLYTTATNSVNSITTSNSSVLVTSSGGAPSWSTVLPAVSGANLTGLSASNVSTGTLGTARLGSGTASSSTYLRGDSTWVGLAASATTDTTSATNITTGTLTDGRLSSNVPLKNTSATITGAYTFSNQFVTVAGSGYPSSGLNVTSSGSGAAYAHFAASDGKFFDFGANSSAGGGDAYFYTTTSPLNFYTGGSVRLNIAHTGEVTFNGGGQFDSSGHLLLKSASTHPTGVEGLIYRNTTDNHVYCYSGSSWRQLDN